MSQYTQPPQPHSQPPYAPAHAPGARPARNGLGIAALVLGIIGSVSGLIPLLFWLAGILGLIALILGLSGRGRVKRGEATNKGVTTFGAVLGLVALILSVVGVVITFKAVDDVVKDIDKEISGSSASAKPGGTGDGGKSGDAPAGEALTEGDSAVYDDGLEVTVNAPAAYTAGEFAIGHTKGNDAYTVSVVIENKGKEKFDAALVTLEARAGKDGVDAEQIFDDKIGEGFTGTVLPGRKITAEYAFDTPADAGNLTVEVSPGFDRDTSHWDLKL
ncbi:MULTISPECIES: DUF4352 domain-containing protein [Streptomyces]|uniref:DUF4352 domain-containing protein n=2 Tax=Streptomyces TaxID=1883 RepID=A0ABV8NA33_9ACTN